MAESDGKLTTEIRAFDAAGTDLQSRADFLELSREQLAAQLEPLELASERGCVEYKQKLASGAFRLLGEAKYKSLSATEIQTVHAELGLLSYTSALQRMMCLGTVRIRDTKRSGTDSGLGEAQKIPIKSIIADVQQRVAADPSVRQQQEIKNILMHLSRYQREAAKVKEASAGAQASVKTGMAENFNRLSQEIFASIRKNYRAIEAEEKEALRHEPGNILLRLPIKEVAPVLRAQTDLSIGIRSRLTRARSQGQGMREAFVETSVRESEYLSLLDGEFEGFVKIAGTETMANRVAIAFAEELRRKIALETEIY